MELSTELKSLYRHWKKHTKHRRKNLKYARLDLHELEKVKRFARERQLIWEHKVSCEEPPYTKDKILQKYRFCNIYRELDKQTMEIHRLLKPLIKDFDIWLLNLMFCRFACRSETVKNTGFLSFDLENNKCVYKTLVQMPRPKYGSAYIFPVSLIMKSDYPTRELFFCKYLPTIAKKCSKLIDSFDNLDVVSALEKVLPVFGYNFRFHWTEIFIDIAYQFPDKINLFSNFPIGPGSIPTLKQLSSISNPENTCIQLTQLPFEEFSYLTFGGRPVLLSAENWEGIGCEYRKYTNLSKGSGRVRLYNAS